MKKAIPLFVFVGLSWFTGCVSIPPLVQVEHKQDTPPAQVSPEVIRRLEAIEQQLQRLEEKLDRK